MMKNVVELKAMIRHTQKAIDDAEASLLVGEPPDIGTLASVRTHISELLAQQAAYYWVLNDNKPLRCASLVGIHERPCELPLGHPGEHEDAL